MRIDNDTLFLDIADTLSRRTRSIGVRQLAIAMNVNYGKARSCIKAAKAKYGKNIFQVSENGIKLTDVGREVHRKLKTLLVSRKNQYQAQLLRPVIMLDPDLEALLISERETASLLTQCRVIPINYLCMLEQLESGEVLLGLGIRHRCLALPREQLRESHFQLVVPLHHWTTIDGKLDVDNGGLCSSDGIAYCHGDERLPGVNLLLQEIPEERRFSCGSYATVINHIIQGKIGMLPLLLELPTDLHHRAECITLVGIESFSIECYSLLSETDQLPPVVSALIAAIKMGALR